MGLYAVTLAGIPAPTSASVVNDLRDRFNDGYVFRAVAGGVSARTSHADYSIVIAHVPLSVVTLGWGAGYLRG